MHSMSLKEVLAAFPALNAQLMLDAGGPVTEEPAAPFKVDLSKYLAENIPTGAVARLMVLNVIEPQQQDAPAAIGGAEVSTASSASADSASPAPETDESSSDTAP